MELFKLRVENLGRIRSAELSIRPLTIFVGPNNTNKTWTAYALYALAQRLCRSPSLLSSLLRSPAAPLVEVHPGWVSVFDDHAERFEHMVSSADRVATIRYAIQRSEMFQDFSTPVSCWLSDDAMGRLLAIPGSLLSSAKVTLDLGTAGLSGLAWDRAQFTYQKEKPTTLILRLEKSGSPPRVFQTVQASLDRGYMRTVMECLVLGAFENVLVFPAERKALVLTYGMTEERLRSRLSIPMQAFLNFMQEGAMESRFEVVETHLPEVLNLFEESIVEGKIEFEREANGATLCYAPRSGPRLPVHAASSLMRSLAGLDIYLRHAAQPGDVIIIDEPEMNAHPEAQLMVSEILGILVNEGIHVVVTTHSPYIVDHINNLVEAADLPEAKQEEVATRFKLGTKAAFLASEKVATYLFAEDGSVTDLMDRERRLINWATFGDTSDYMGNVYSEILEVGARE